MNVDLRLKTKLLSMFPTTTIMHYLPAATIVLLSAVVLVLVWMLVHSSKTGKELGMQVLKLQDEIAQMARALDEKIAIEQEQRRLEKAVHEASRLEEEVAIAKGAILSDTTLLNRIERLAVRNIGNPEFTANTVAQVFCLTRTQLDRRLKRAVGKSASAYLQGLRMEKARELLLTTTKAVAEVAVACGFEDTSYFTRVFRNYYECSPSEVRKGGA